MYQGCAPLASRTTRQALGPVSQYDRVHLCRVGGVSLELQLGAESRGWRQTCFAVRDEHPRPIQRANVQLVTEHAGK
jgi:hypothetical protein